MYALLLRPTKKKGQQQVEAFVKFLEKKKNCAKVEIVQKSFFSSHHIDEKVTTSPKLFLKVDLNLGAPPPPKGQ